MINFTNAFDSAWERMMVILFRPFDAGKWFVIGFGAFLAGLLSGGNGANFSGNFPTNYGNNSSSGSSWSTSSANSDFQSISNSFTGLQAGIIIAIVLIVVVFVLAFMVLFYWLGARGQFILLDNLVRNRAEISWPWKHYARLANSLFFAHIIFLVISMAIMLPILGLGVIILLPFIQHHDMPGTGRLVAVGLLAVAYLLIAFVMAVAFFIFREFGVALMFRNGLTWWPAFRASMALIGRHPGSITLFVLLRLALALAVIVVSVIVMCATCCIAAIPYIGTVALLPAIVYLRCFSLDCLAQFGPEYDVWTVDVPPGYTAPPVNPPPPLG